MSRERLLKNAAKYQTGTYSTKFVAPVYQKMIRAEAGADYRPFVPAVVDGAIRQVRRGIGQCVCITCGNVGSWDSGLYGIHTGHFLASRCNSIIFEEDNAEPQCYECNCYRSGNPQAFRMWMIAVRGPKVVERLERLKAKSVSFTREELVDKRIQFEARLAEAIKRMETN